MKRLAIILTFLLMFPASTLAKNWQDLDTTANDDCAKLARACTGAARELKAARDLIKGYESHIVAADVRLELARQELATLKEAGALERERAAQLEAVIKAEREAKATLIKLKEEQTARIAKLEGRLKRSRKVALIAGVVAVVAILIRVRR